jgi:hypothetical protein
MYIIVYTPMYIIVNILMYIIVYILTYIIVLKPPSEAYSPLLSFDD